MKGILFDVAFWIVVISFGTALIKELIPEHVKKYWKYQRQMKKDEKAGVQRKWIWTFKNSKEV